MFAPATVPVVSSICNLANGFVIPIPIPTLLFNVVIPDTFNDDVHVVILF